MSDTRDFDIEDTVILIDTSRSLARTDFYPSRFEVLKGGAVRFLESKGKIDPEEGTVVANVHRGLGNFTPEELEEYTMKGHQSFYSNPSLWMNGLSYALMKRDMRPIHFGLRMFFDQH